MVYAEKKSFIDGKRLIIKTTLIVISAVLIVLLVLFGVQSRFITRGVLEEQKLNTMQQANLLAEMFDTRINASFSALKSYAARPVEMSPLLGLIKTRETLFSDVMLVDQASFEVLAAEDTSLTGKSLAGIPVFDNNLALGSLFFTDPYPFELIKGRGFGIAVGVRVENGPDIGKYLIAIIGSDLLKTEYFDHLKVGRQGYPFIVDRAGHIVGHPDKALLGVDLSEYGFIQEMTNDSQESGFIGYYWSKGSDSRKIYQKYLSFKRMKATEWVIGVSLYSEDLLLVALTTNRVSYLLGFAALIMIGLVLSFFLHRALIGRFLTINRVVLQASKGDLTVRIPVKGKDEVAQMSRGLNDLLDSVQQAVGAISKGVLTLNEVSENLSSNSTETAAGISQIQSNVIVTQGRMSEQQESLSETASVTEQMARNIDSLALAIKNQAAAVTESSAAIEQMISNFASVSGMTGTTETFVNGLQAHADEGKECLAGVAELVKQVIQSSDNLSSATSLISTIASQTNLLAMNAAIEAAHAGDAGKGFAVVADEIRKLAEDAAKQAKAINGTIREVKGLIGNVDDRSIQTTKAFEKIDSSVGEVFNLVRQINSAMTEQNAGSTQILEALTSMRDITVLVEQGSTEMSVGNSRLLEVFTALKDITVDVNDRMTEIISGIAEMNKAIQQISELGVQNKDTAGIIQVDIERFKVSSVS